MAIVYKITNTINNKSYVGQTIYSIEHRWSRHLSAAKSGSPFRFHSAIRKYGPDPWKLEVLFEDENTDIIRKYEETVIEQENLTHSKYGYNAKPGGCGGWIVRDVETWKQKQSMASSGFGNANAGDITNEEIVALALAFCEEHNRIPSFPALRKYAEKQNKYIPKMFSKFRFDGKYSNLVKIVEEQTNLKYNKYFKDETHRQNISNAQKGKKHVKY